MCEDRKLKRITPADVSDWLLAHASDESLYVAERLDLLELAEQCVDELSFLLTRHTDQLHPPAGVANALDRAKLFLDRARAE